MKINTLKWTSRACVALVFCLILVGALVTSWQAGMAVPDWPLSFGSLNPEGWWNNFPVRLEHGHRVLAASVGVVVGILCAGVWGNTRALLMALGVSVLASVVGGVLGVSPSVRAHLGIWPAAIAFVGTLLLGGSARSEVGRIERVLSLIAFILVCAQATLGGLRVTRETAGLVDVAVVLRIVHGCVAQAFLVSLVALAVRIGIVAGAQENPRAAHRPSSTVAWAWAAMLAVYAQLVLGATMRHLGAGLAIPTFPAANPDGGWLPQVHNLYTDLNFGHTRIGAIFVSAIVLGSVVKTMRFANRGTPIWSGSLRSAIIVLLQVGLGILVVLHQKPKTLASLHVVLGAALLASLAAVLVHTLSGTSGSRGEVSP